MSKANKHENGFINRLRRWLGGDEPAAAPGDQPGDEVIIPQAWLDAAQAAVGGAPDLQRDDLIAARRAEAENKSDIDTVALRTAMLNNFAPADLDQLCSALGLDAAQLSGGKGRQVMGLLMQAQHAGKLEALLAACRARWPDVAWQ